MSGSEASTDSGSLSPEQSLQLYRTMALGRAAEERLEVLFKQGHIKGGLYRSLGQEAVGSGVCFALERRSDGTGDIIGQTIRTTGAVFMMGGRPIDYFRQYLSRETGPTAGKEANVHWSDFARGLVGPVSPLGTMVEVLAGITLAFKLRNQPRVGVVFGGDGQTSTGAWHEGVNFAATQGCPLVIVVQANQWAFSTPTSKQTRLQSFSEKAAGYGLPAESIDGNDVLAVYDAARRAVAHARAGRGPVLLEMRTYRRLGHAQHDAQEYVSPEELEAWAAQDPLLRYSHRLRESGIPDDALKTIHEEVAAEVAAAAEQAVSEPAPTPASALDEVYVTPTAKAPWTRGPDSVSKHPPTATG